MRAPGRGNGGGERFDARPRNDEFDGGPQERARHLFAYLGVAEVAAVNDLLTHMDGGAAFGAQALGDGVRLGGGAMEGEHHVIHGTRRSCLADC